MALDTTASSLGIPSESLHNKRKRANSTEKFVAGPTLGRLTPEKYLEKCKMTGSSPLPWACPPGIVIDPISCRPRKRQLMDDFGFKPETKRLRLRAALAARRERLVRDKGAEANIATDSSQWDIYNAEVEKDDDMGAGQESDGADDDPGLEEEANDDEGGDKEEDEEKQEKPERREQDDQDENENESDSCTLYESSCGYRGRGAFDSDFSEELSEYFTSHDA